MQNEPFSISKRLKSFAFAFQGIRTLIKDEHNAWIHLFAAGCAIILSFYFCISTLEWIAILFAIGFVIAMEMVNSAIENLCDFASPEKHELIKKTKDLAAGAVLMSAIIALIIGLIIFVPKIVIVIEHFSN